MREKMPDNPYFQKNGSSDGEINEDLQGDPQNQKKKGGKKFSDIIKNKGA